MQNFSELKMKHSLVHFQRMKMIVCFLSIKNKQYRMQSQTSSSYPVFACNVSTLRLTSLCNRAETKHACKQPLPPQMKQNTLYLRSHEKHISRHEHQALIQMLCGFNQNQDLSNTKLETDDAEAFLNVTNHVFKVAY